MSDTDTDTVTATREEWSIHEVATATGTTTRTLRHYDQVGLLAPSRTGANGYRHYDRQALHRLQRILLLRDLGLSLTAIADVLSRVADERDALTAHLAWLREERARLERRIASVERTIDAHERKDPIMPEEMFDGFDHTAHKDEVVQRWGAEAYQHSDDWWRGMSGQARQEFQADQQAIQRDFARALAEGEDPAGERAQSIVQRHFAWVQRAWGGRAPDHDQFTGLGALYVDDPRFAANYGGAEGAEFVRDAMAAFAEQRLGPA